MYKYLIILLIPVFVNASIPKFSEVDFEIYRGGQPTEFQDFVLLKEKYKIKTIINLKTIQNKMEEKFCQRLDIKLIRLPMFPMFPVSDKTIETALETLITNSTHPIFIHCEHGKDRTGLVIGLYRLVCNWSKPLAYEEMRSFGFSPWLVFLENYFWNFY